MKNLEYLFVICDYRKHASMPRYINGEEIDDWKKKINISEFANQKGSEGWELIAADNTAQEYIFKRNKQESIVVKDLSNNNVIAKS